jgi:putative cell wall-binding protein
MKKILFYVLLIFLLGVNGIAVKAENLPPTSIDQSMIENLKKMTLDELRSVAQPMPEAALKVYEDTPLGTAVRLRIMANVPYEGIYVVKNTTTDGTVFEEYYQFLYAKPTETNTIEYHLFCWDCMDGRIVTAGETRGSEVNRELYSKLVPQNNDSDNENQPGNTDDSNNANEPGNSNDSNNGSAPVVNKINKRLTGATRQATARLIAEEYNSGTVNNVVLATGNNFPDALAGSPLAYKLDAPILLVGTTEKESQEADLYIQKYLADNGTIYILGGEGAVSSSTVEKYTKQGFKVKRISGQGRYDTNQAINDELNSKKGTPVFIATGTGFADALSVSSIAAAKGYPIVLTEKDTLPEQAIETLTNLMPTQVFIVGGENAVSESVKNQIAVITKLKDDRIDRIAGEGRYNTSLAIAKFFDFETVTATFATGKNFPDALAGSILAAKNNAPVILLGDDLALQEDYLESKDFLNQYILGGEGAIKKEIEMQLFK